MMQLVAALSLVYIFVREIMYQHERKLWMNERKDLYSRIQAGTLQEYISTTKEPSQAMQKPREQRVSEEAADKGLMRQDLQYPAHWKG